VDCVSANDSDGGGGDDGLLLVVFFLDRVELAVGLRPFRGQAPLLRGRSIDRASLAAAFMRHWASSRLPFARAR